MLGPRAEFAVLKGKSAVLREISPNSPSISLPSGPGNPSGAMLSRGAPLPVRQQPGPGPATSPPTSLPAAASGAEGSPVASPAPLLTSHPSASSAQPPLRAAPAWALAGAALCRGRHPRWRGAGRGGPETPLHYAARPANRPPSAQGRHPEGRARQRGDRPSTSPPHTGSPEPQPAEQS